MRTVEEGCDEMDGIGETVDVKIDVEIGETVDGMTGEKMSSEKGKRQR